MYEISIYPDRQSYAEDYSEGDGQEYPTREAALDAAREYSGHVVCILRDESVDSFVAIQDGEIVAEWGDSAERREISIELLATLYG